MVDRTCVGDGLIILHLLQNGLCQFFRRTSPGAVHECHLACSVMQSSFALMVSFKSPASRLAHDETGAGAAGGAGLDFGLRASCWFSGVSTAAGCSEERSSTGRGFSMAHEARNSTAGRYFIVFSPGAIDR